MGPLTSFRRAPSSSPAKVSSAILLALSSVRPFPVSSPVPLAPDASSGNSAVDRRESGLRRPPETTGTWALVPQFPPLTHDHPLVSHPSYL
uniref:Uncharacterized protein n=2 Tax=Bos TaxID=9903 RepID=A0A4W2FBL7_BOBOX